MYILPWGVVQIHYFKGKYPIITLFSNGATILCKERCTLSKLFHSLIRNVYIKNACVCAFLFLTHQLIWWDQLLIHYYCDIPGKHLQFLHFNRLFEISSLYWLVFWVTKLKWPKEKKGRNVGKIFHFDQFTVGPLLIALVTEGNGELKKSCCHTLWRKQTKKNAPIFDAIQRFRIKYLLKKNYSFKINALLYASIML